MLKAAILIEDMVEDIEFLYPYYRLLEEGYEVDVISQSKKKIQGKKGGSFKADKAIEEVQSSDYAILFIPGGYAPDKLRTDQKILDLVTGLDKEGKIIAAICHGPWVLVSAGVCKGRKISCFHSIKDDVINAGGIYTKEPVSVHKNMITATDPSALPQMFQQLVQLLKQD